MKYEKLTSGELHSVIQFLKKEIRIGYSCEIMPEAIIFKILDKDIFFKLSVFERIKEIRDFEAIKFTEDGFALIFDNGVIEKLSTLRAIIKIKPDRNQNSKFTIHNS